MKSHGNQMIYKKKKYPKWDIYPFVFEDKNKFLEKLVDLIK